MSICLSEFVSGPTQWVEGSEQARVRAGLLWGFTEATDTVTDTWQTFVRHPRPSSLWGLKSSYWFLCGPTSDEGPLTTGLPQPGTPPFSGWSVTQKICQQGLTSCLDQISPNTFYLIFTAPLRVSKTSVRRHWASQGKPAFSRSQGLQQREQNQNPSHRKELFIERLRPYEAVPSTL